MVDMGDDGDIASWIEKPGQKKRRLDEP